MVLAARRTPEKMFGLLDMLDGVEAALPLLRAALAVAVPRLDRTSVGAGDAPAAAAQLMQVRCAVLCCVAVVVWCAAVAAPL